MTFNLENFHLFFDETLLDTAHALLKQGGVTRLRELEKNLWAAIILQNNTTFEAEILLSGKRVRKYACECGNYHSRKICVHIAALLYQVNKISQATPLPAPETPKANTAQRISVQTILEGISHDDLKAYVRQYATQNRLFAVGLKVNFITQIPLEDFNEKYQRILDVAWQTLNLRKEKYSLSETKPMLKVITDLSNRFDALLVQAMFGDAVLLLNAVSPALWQLQQRLPEGTLEIEYLVVQHFQQCQALLTHPNVPPIAVEELSATMLARLQQHNGNFTLFQKSAIQCLIVGSPKADYTQALATYLEHLSPVTESQHCNAICYLLQLYDINKKSGAIEIFTRMQLSPQPQLLQEVVYALQKQKEYTLAKSVILSAIKEPINAEQVLLNLQKSLLEIARVLEDNVLVQNLSKMLFVETLQHNYYELYKSTFQENWEAGCASLLEILSNEEDTPAIYLAMARIYAAEQKMEELLALLQFKGDIDTIQYFDNQLFRYNKKTTANLYEHLITQYLDNHLGRTASEKVAHIIFRLRKAGEAEAANSLLHFVRTKYAHRHTLLEELGITPLTPIL